MRNRPLAEQMLICAALFGISSYGLPVKNRVLNLNETWDMAIIPTTSMLLIMSWIGPAKQDLVAERLFRNKKSTSKWSWQCEWLIRRYGEVLHSGDESEIPNAVHSLRQLAPGYRSALALLCGALESEDPARRRIVAPLLGSLHTVLPTQEDHDLAVESLIGGIRRESEVWNLLIEVQALAMMGPKAVRSAMELLLSLTEHDEQSVRAIAFDAIASLGLEQFQYLTDERLAQLLDNVGAEASFLENGTIHFYGLSRNGMSGLTADQYLLEIVRRGTPFFQRRLQERLETRFEVPGQQDICPSGVLGLYRISRELGQLEILTALRRLQHRPDPLTVEIRLGEVSQGLLEVRLVNTDPDRQTLLMQQGGDNRGPRQERFHIEVRDAESRLLPTQFQTDNFGGISSLMELSPGASMSFVLNLSAYANMPAEPGEYTIVLHYHNVLQIAAEPDVSQFITSHSEPIPVTVK